MKNSIVVGIVAILLFAHNSSAFKIDTNIQNKNVERSLDLTTQLVKVNYKITLVKKDSADATYTFVVPNADREHLAYISIRDTLKKELKATEEKISEGAAFTVSLTSSSAMPVLNIETVFTKSLQPYPTHITQSERQLVRYFGNAYFYSPYKTVAQKTTALLASKSVESYTNVKPSTQSENTITYGPYENIAGLYLFISIFSVFYQFNFLA